MMLRAALIAALLLLAGCQTQASPPDTAPAPQSPMKAAFGPERPQSAAACAQAGGEWRKGGLAGVVQCFLQYPDAGQSCAGPADCRGLCIAPSDGPPRCQATYPLFGCVRYLDAKGNRVGVCID